MPERDLINLLGILQTSPQTTRVAQIGMCRVWTKQAITLAQEFKQKTSANFTLEAREIFLEAGLEHTFLRALTDDRIAYIYDGVGTMQHPPYLGPESVAPKIYRASHLDLIHFLDIEGKM